MPLNGSGAISLAGATAGQSIALELGLGTTTQISLNDAAVRTLFGVPSGAIAMNVGYGKSNAFSATISSNQTNLNLRTWALANGWNGSTAATITIGSGVYIYSTSTGTPALTTDSFPGGLTIINNGFIAGMGGNGAPNTSPYAGTAGGNAISLGSNVTINNTNASAYIGGGGGGGGFTQGGGGAGGGAGGAVGPNAAGGGVGSAGTTPTGGAYAGKGGGAGGGGGAYSGSGKSTAMYGGGGGGRIFPGSGGAGGTNGGGAGGSANGVGGTASTAVNYLKGGGGGGWGAAGGTGGNGNAGGAGGKAVALNGYTVTWTSGDTTRVYGAVS
jgi:hypothetical protein